MSTFTKTVPNAEPAERATAALQIVLPVGVGILAPYLDPNAAAYAGAASSPVRRSPAPTT